jgi:hypothetical protein
MLARANKLDMKSNGLEQAGSWTDNVTTKAKYLKGFKACHQCNALPGQSKLWTVIRIVPYIYDRAFSCKCAHNMQMSV